jgi:hypothetical protein
VRFADARLAAAGATAKITHDLGDAAQLTWERIDDRRWRLRLHVRPIAPGKLSGTVQLEFENHSQPLVVPVRAAVTSSMAAVANGAPDG